MDITLPGEIQSVDDCQDENICVRTKDWDFGSDDSYVVYANRIKNGSTPYYLVLNFQTGKITCRNNESSDCDYLCGGDGCKLN